MLNVFLTIDTEIWPFSSGWPTIPLSSSHSDFTAEIGFYILGQTGSGSFGVPFQLACLKQYGLRATYFVESLSACVTGLKSLREVVSLIQGEGQEVQLHAHTEWLGEIRSSAVPRQFRQYIRQFSETEQAAIIGQAAANLRAAGASSVCAFRAGSFGANFDTLRALSANGIRFDSSHNACLLNMACALDTKQLITQPVVIEGVHEFPVSCFSDYPGNYRHAQVCACSFGEMKDALLDAWRAGWYSFVILLHGSELLGERTSFAQPAVPSRLIVRRFRKLCEFLAANTDKFHTAVFSEIDSSSIPWQGIPTVLRSRVHQTAWRVAEQIAGRLF